MLDLTCSITCRILVVAKDFTTIIPYTSSLHTHFPGDYSELIRETSNQVSIAFQVGIFSNLATY